MYNQYQYYQQQNPSTTTYSSSQASNWNTTQTSNSHSNYSSSSQFSSGANNPQPTNNNTQALPVKPVEHYTTCYHGWNTQATELEQQLRMLPANNFEGKKDIQNRHEWAKYYADLSSKAAHFFYQNPNANSAPFDLPPEPPKKASSISSTTPTKSNHSASYQTQANPTRPYAPKNATQTPGTLEDYVRACLNQCKTPEQKKIVQSKVEIKIAEAIQKGDMHSRNWSREPLVPVPGSPSSSKKKKKSKKDSTSNLSYGNSGGNGSSTSVHYGPTSSSLSSSTNPSLASSSLSYYGAASGSSSLSSQKRKTEDFIGFAKLNNKKHKSGKDLNGFQTSSKVLAKRANRFSGAGGIHDVQKSSLKSIGGGHDKYMGKSMIGGSKVTLDENDFERMTVKGTCTILEKEYLRLTAPPRPELVRPEPILKIYLKKLKKQYAKPDHKDYLWFCSQFKAMRQDCTVQRIQNEFAVDVYETHARIALQEGDLNEYNQCQTQLQDLYRDNPSMPNHEEFIAYKLLYYVVLSCNDQYDGGSSDMFKIMLSLNDEQRQHPAIEHALKVRECMAVGNYLHFFRLHGLSPNLGDMLTSRIVPTMRLRGLRRMAKAYRPTLDIRVCTEHLGFDSVEEGKDWLVRCGCVLEGPKISMKDSVIHEPTVEDDKKNSLI